ncbi:MAG: dipicolinate synthase subunit DpsA [Ruminococcus sp.]|nr:dipicolinate synthase subunit DpsA [Ruminococcus sp.]
MKEIKSFGIAGGDKRQLFLAKSISDNCYDVQLGGFEKLKSTGSLVLCDMKTMFAESDAIIFPVPSVRADHSINTPFSYESYYIDNEDILLIKNKPIFISMKENFLRAYPQLQSAELYDYSAEEEFAILNALPTAEGAIEVAMTEYEGTISGSKTLIVGYGRIGKLLSNKLKVLGSEVTVAARSKSDLAYIKALGYGVRNTNQLKSVKGFDMVFNTVPAKIFDKDLLMNTDRNTLIIDLASLPGGVDFEIAKQNKIDAVRALSLPGKTSPKTAGEIIKTVIFNIIEEVYR